MRFHPTGLCTVYADESDDKQRFVLAFVSIPTLAMQSGPAASALADKWKNYFRAAKGWRAELKRTHNIPVSKELKGSKLATGRNRYDGGTAPLYGRRAIAAYSYALSQLNFLPPQSVFSVYATRDYNMYGHRKLEASLYAAFQRIQSQNSATGQHALIIFDEGHGEYRTLYRKACVHLPTGSSQGGWVGQRSKNIPLTTTIKDANFKDSKTSHFIQIADLVAYATLVKARAELGALSDREKNLSVASLHDSIPRRVLNTKVKTGGTDGIDRLR
ncbi:DUF3800 domain-containing protein [Roseitranquillus sediminis]|uniref:DUF3800 domain-containing protein n=1 Tax=Roseitranquillus sediminis TaxID=2809051 RepID=UPI001D0CD842|nr:DUF3800 domain-containing protein [Roseitranquillus sediminis]MBM9594468.1 DUF3800 domain-containing protein [Roseitranquillus sediminis]